MFEVFTLLLHSEAWIGQWYKQTPPILTLHLSYLWSLVLESFPVDYIMAGDVLRGQTSYPRTSGAFWTLLQNRWFSDSIGAGFLPEQREYLNIGKGLQDIY